MDVAVPLVVLLLMVILQIFLDQDLEEDTSQTPRDDYGRITGVTTDKKQRLKRILKQVVLPSLSKLLYASLKKAPGVDDGTATIIAHVVAFVLDMATAFYVWWNHRCLDERMLKRRPLV
jgi:hypothetical protein